MPSASTVGESERRRLQEPYATLEVVADNNLFGPYDFIDAADVANWAALEEKFWSGVQKRALQVRGLESNAFNPCGTEIEHYTRLRDVSLQAAEKADLDSEVRQLLQDTVALVHQRRMLLRRATLTERILAMESTQPLLFFFALTLGRPYEGMKFGNITGNVDISAVIAGSVLRHPPRLADIYSDSDRLDKAHNDAINKTSDLGSKIEQVEGLEQTLREKLLLDPARSYWNGKASEHANNAMIAGVTTLSLIFAAVLFFFTFGLEKIALAASTFKDGEHWAVFVFVTVPLLAVFYGLRLLVKFFGISLQRWGDAQERATMVQTYLALSQQETRKPTEAERLLILRQLFRPGPGDSFDDSQSDTMLSQIFDAMRNKGA